MKDTSKVEAPLVVLIGIGEVANRTEKRVIKLHSPSSSSGMNNPARHKALQD